MTKVNNIFNNLSYLGIDLSIDLFTATNHFQAAEVNYAPYCKDKLIYGENVHYDQRSEQAPSSYGGVISDFNYADGRLELNLNSIGYNNTRRLFSGRGNDSIIGFGNAIVTGNFQAIALGESTFIDTSSTDSTARVAFAATVEATGIKNSGRIATARGNDTVLGISDVQSTASIFAESIAMDLSLAIARSEATVSIDVLAIGVENGGNIFLGKGKDLFVGIANTSIQSEAKATAIANAFDLNLSPEVVEELNGAVADSNSVAEAVNLVGTIGIANRGNIFLNQGNDVIFGLANSQISSDASSNSQAVSRANRVAFATANAEAVSIAESFTIGIINEGLMATGWGNDTLIGLAFNQSEADAEADAEADSATAITDANTNTLAISDTSNTTVIGIDNSSGVIRTGSGMDRIIAYGSDIGIKGGKIKTGNNNDKIFGYGNSVGVEDTTINAGRGHDYFQAAIGSLDPFTGEVNLAEDGTSSIRNSKIFGGAGNDTFEIGGFDGTVLIDGGRDFDTLRLSGDVDRYGVSVSSLSEQTLTIEDSSSILTVKNVEAIYFGDRQQALNISNFA